MQADMAKGFTAFKTGPAKKRPARYIETPAAVHYAAERFAELRKTAGDEVRYRHRFPRRHQPGHGETADQRRWSPTARCSSKNPARRRITT